MRYIRSQDHTDVPNERNPIDLMYEITHPRGRRLDAGPHDRNGRRRHHRAPEDERGPRREHGPRGDHRRAGIRLQMRRGSVRDAILGLLAEDPMHGYQIMQELDSRSGGRWQPSAGSIYPTLQQLEDEGLVRATDQDGRRTFELTDRGRTAVVALPADRPWMGRERGDDLRGLARELELAAIQVARVGSPAAAEAARRVLGDARRALYRLLAEDAAEASTDPSPAASDTASDDGASDAVREVGAPDDADVTQS